MSEKPEADTPRFLAWLYSTPAQQPVLAALCAIEREVATSLRPGLDHQVAHTRLEWWREECARCAAGSPAHPLTRELRGDLQRLAPAARVDSVLAELSGLTDAATWDLARATFEHRAELTAYCRRWAAAMVAPLGAPEVDWTDFGAALRELELLGHLARDAGAGRVRIPLDELEQAAVAPQAVATPPWPRGLVEILQRRHQTLRRQLAAAVAGLAPPIQQSGRGILVWAALAWQASHRAERALPRAAGASIASAAAANWRAWRAARAAAAGSLRLA
ncbi:MAG TPA: squalene/phytoene synthase family protein [Steroidobacteraceae bacterium]|jgi:phytoene synthase|nr:squalene/phytoene synthase family protein [Steroidobacteraceae bacterium]